MSCAKLAAKLRGGRLRTVGLQYVRDCWCVCRGSVEPEGPALRETIVDFPITCTNLRLAILRMHKIAGDERRVILGVYRLLTDDECAEILELLTAYAPDTAPAPPESGSRNPPR